MDKQVMSKLSVSPKATPEAHRINSRKAQKLIEQFIDKLNISAAEDSIRKMFFSFQEDNNNFYNSDDRSDATLLLFKVTDLLKALKKY